MRAGGSVIRRQVLTKLDVTDAGSNGEPAWVWDVVVGGRSPSPFPGTMGAHSTAWVAHIDAIRRHLVNLSPVDGAKYLIDLARDSADKGSSPLLALRDTLPPEQKQLMKTARTTMLSQATILERLAGQRAPDTAAMISAVRTLIDGYLTYVNYLPTATVKGGDPSGHGEGVARGLLNQFEYICGLTKRSTDLAKAGSKDEVGPARDESGLGLLPSALEQVKSSTFGKLLVAGSATDFDPGQNPLLRTEMVQQLWSMFAAETPGVYAQQRAADPVRVWVAALKNFLHTIRLAYPNGYEFTRMATPDAQWDGLLYAASEAGVTIGDDLAKRLHQAVTGHAAKGGHPGQAPLAPEEPELRGLDQYAEVAASDLWGGGAGFTVTVLMAGPQVGSVEMTGRTTSPFVGTMGAHTTAWAAVLDALRAKLKNKDLPTAIDDLRKLANAAMTSSRLDLTHLIDEKHQHRLALAYTDLRSITDDNRAFLSDQSRIGYLELLIKAHLTFTNLLPLSTVAFGGVPGGHAEGKARTFLQSFEEHGAAAIPPGVHGKNYVTKRLLAMFDADAPEQFPPDLGDREAWPDPTHPLATKYASIAEAPDRDDIEATAVTEFYDTVSVAYPKSVTYIGWTLDPDDPRLPVEEMDTGDPVVVPPDPITGGGMKRARPTADVPGPVKKIKKAPLGKNNAGSRRRVTTKHR